MPQAENQGAAAAGDGTNLQASAKSLELQKRQTGEFVDKVAQTLGVPRWAKREFLQPVAQELAETIKTTGSIDQAKADELFERAYEQGIVIQDEMVQQYGDLKKELRRTPLTLDSETREGKSYQELRKRMFGSLNLTADGVPVDTYYQELCERYPELFDAETINPADQIERIYEVYKNIHTQEVNLDAYYGDDADEFKAWARDEFDRALETLTDGVYKVRRLEMDNAAAAAVAQEEIPPMSYAEVERIQHEAKKLQRKADQAMSRAALTEGDKDLVKKLLRGDTSEEFLRSKGQENLDDILRVYKARKAVQDARQPVRAYNEKIRQQRAARANMLTEQAKKYRDEYENRKWNDAQERQKAYDRAVQ